MHLLHRARCAILVTLVLLAAAGAAAQRRPPKLIVILVVDQMRGDYLDRFQHQWTRGLRRLVDEGAVFKQANFSYFGTLTCAGHATIATGTIPAVHGMVLDGWWDHAAGRRVRCTGDPKATVIRYGRGGRGGDGPAPLRIPTLADELRAQLAAPPRIVSFSIKARAAIALAGQQADAVAWFDDGDSWVTSSAYSAAPVPFVAEFVKANPVEADLGKVWRQTLGEKDALYNGAPNGSQLPPFPHALAGESDAPDAKFYTAWKTSPFADEYLVRMAVAAVRSLNLGKGAATDYLAVSFSAPDYVGHDYGPRSIEVQEAFVRLDAALGTLLTELDRTVGRGEYVVAFSADHGVAPIPEWGALEGFDAGRIGREDVADRVNKALVPLLGDGRHVGGMVHTDFFFAPGVYEKLRANPEAMGVALETIRAVPGVAVVYRREQLLADTLTDPLARQVARSYHPGRSGDLVIIPKPYWYTWNRGADHGTGYEYDTRVPLVLMGKGIKAGEYLQPADPADIAPTLALLTGITLSRPDGRVLAEALGGTMPSEAPTAGR